tara:strand:+ start:167 stop:913 length:747 start_codon:yes stop_codon:yes gene_type:complete
MKRLILLQNDYPGTGKSTLAQCFSHYLRQYGVAHQMVSLTEEGEEAQSGTLHLETASLTPRELLACLDESPLTILDIDTGAGEFFHRFYEEHEIEAILGEAGISLSVVLPITSERESFDSVVQAAEVYSDNAEYLIAHLITSSYEDDDKVWDSSYAARVMDMFEAVELHIPEIGFQMDTQLKARHLDLAEVLRHPEEVQMMGKDFEKWLARVQGQIESTRQFLFGDAFRPTIMVAPPKKARRKRAVKA